MSMRVFIIVTVTVRRCGIAGSETATNSRKRVGEGAKTEVGTK